MVQLCLRESYDRPRSLTHYIIVNSFIKINVSKYRV